LKKFFLALLLIFAACVAEDERAGRPPLSVVPDHVVGERLFVQQMMEFFINHPIYIGDIIQYEGYFLTEPWYDDEEFFTVARTVPGCCSPTELMGFEILLNDWPRPDEFAWVEVTGTLFMDETGFLVIDTIYLLEVERAEE
jgi:uncharacterized membrane protein YcgQ (UPF0703/DUF1980 family)